MKEEILKLREEGKTYNQIKEILGCSKSTISYHCGDGQKEKTKKRTRKRRENILLSKVDRFKYRTQDKVKVEKKYNRTRKDVVESTRKFQKRDSDSGGDGINKNIQTTFTWEDVIEKFGVDIICYLSGKPINLFENNYHLDHITPVSKGGDNTLDNLGIAHQITNQMKGGLTPEELISWCITILEHNGYQITKTQA